MELEEIYTALGLEQSQEAQEEQRPAEPTESGEETGGAGDPDQEERGSTAPGSGEEDPPGEDEDAGDGSRKMDQERQRRAGEAERQADITAAVERAVAQERQRHQRQMKEFFAVAGMRDPNTGRPITTMEEFEAYSRESQERRIQQNLAAGKLTETDLDFLIRRRLEASGKDPSRNPGRDEPGPQGIPANGAPGTETVTQEMVDAQLREIHRLDPGVSSLEDILKGPDKDAFVSAVRRGNNFLDAFRLASFDRLRQRRQSEAVQRAAQAERNRSRSKGHMAPTESRGEGGIDVPAEVMAEYRLLMPGATDEEIRRHYGKFVKKK